MTSAHYARDGNIAVITMDNPPVNGLGQELRVAVIAGLDRAVADPGIEAIVLMGANGVFSGGADIRQVDTPKYWAYPRTIELAHYLDQVGKPVVAAIGKLAMGGGLELAMGCHYRVAVRDARLALPEVKLGLLPGGGGTLRLPRLIGVERAVDMMLQGYTIGSEQALSWGLIDAVVGDDLLTGSLDFARNLARRAMGPRRAIDRPAAMDDAAGFFARMRAPLAPGRAQATILACLEASVTGPLETAIAITDAGTRALMESEESRALRYLFFSERLAGKVAGAPRMLGRSLVVSDSSRTAAAQAIALRLGKSSGPAAVAVHDSQAWHAPVEASAALAEADLIVVATSPDSAAVRALLVAVDRDARSGAILALTGDIIDTTVMPNSNRDIVGLRFADGGTGKLVEVVRTARCTDAGLAAVSAYARRCGGIPVIHASVGAPLWRPVLARAQAALCAHIAGGTARVQLAETLRQWGFEPAAISLLLGNGDALDRDHSSDPQAPPATQHSAAPDVIAEVIAAMAEQIDTMVQAGLAVRTADVDVAMVQSGIFPAFRGGPWHYRDHHADAAGR
jgi:3-hydroxyacyl-CoA dehydrogenase